MNTIKNNFLKILFGLLVITSFSSCDEGGDPDPGGTTTEKFAGDWYISVLDSNGDILVDHALHATYNSAANDNTMWIDDNPQHASTPNGWWLKAKITVDLSNGTFSGTSQKNLNDPTSTVIITEGKIEKDAGVSKAGHKVDKISFKAEFSYDPGNVLTFVGHKRTGFKEDEY